MLTDDLAHLDILLSKEPIVGTVTPQDILDRPEFVQESYLKHIRSFVVLERAKTSAEDSAVTVKDFEKRFIKLVKEKGAVKGYITADYGYGKTSTALFVWHQCEQAEILAVPPFQIEKLEHLLISTYGWVRFILGRNYPHLVARADEIYNRYVNNDVTTQADSEEGRKALRKAYDEGRLSLKLTDLDYIRFFEEMTNLAHEAHYQGLVVIADELQQYIEVHRTSGDPLTAIFNIVRDLIVRKGHLAFGLLFSITRRDLGFMNDFRSDLVQRLKSDNLALDLRLIYNQTFARDLWHQLAHDLHFESIKDCIVLPEALEALGQISARSDLSSGPRTVINAYHEMVRRYQENNGNISPFTPLDLIDAFMSGKISYDNTGELTRVINNHLNNQFVRNNLEYQKAIKLIAAFPMDGLREAYLDTYGVRQAVEDLQRMARGDIITFIGSRYDRQGQEREQCAFLVGLEANPVKTDWLSSTTREFIQNYNEYVYEIRDLMVEGFQRLLKEVIFKQGTWKLVHSLEITFSQNRAFIWTGDFPSTRKNYPDRRLHVRIIREGEGIRDNVIDGDLALNIELLLHLDQPEALRGKIPGQLIPQDKTISLQLNMNHYSGERDDSLNSTLGQTVVPWQMTPALLLSFYAYLDKKRAKGLIPTEDDESIKNIYQPLLIEYALRDLFNASLGASVKANEVRIMEEAVRLRLEACYPDYKTLVTSTQWKHNMREYQDAMAKLSTSAERQGKLVYEGSKQELAKLFGRTSPAVDSFIATNPLLLRHEQNGWHFILHPLEARILKQIQSSILQDSSRKGMPRPYIQRVIALQQAKELGYREEEVETVIQFLITRGLISLDAKGTRLIEEIMRIPQVADLRAALEDYQCQVLIFAQVLPENTEIADRVKEAESLQKMIDGLARSPDDQRQISLETLIQNRQKNLTMWMQKEQNAVFMGMKQIHQQLSSSQFNADVLNKPIEGNLFSAQLNTQREALQREYNTTINKIDVLKKQISDVLRNLEQGPLSADNLASVLKQSKNVQKDIIQPQERLAQIKDMLHLYSQTRQLQQQAQSLLSRLQQAPTTIVPHIQGRLDKWALSITSELSSSKLSSLKREQQWREQFDAIEQDFREQMQAEEAHFLSIQSDYQTYLQQKFSAVLSWSSIVFNPSQPQDSYARLWNSVHVVLQNAVKKAHEQVQVMHHRAARLLGGIATLPPDMRSGAQEFLNEILPQLSLGVEKTTKWLDDVAGTDFINPVIKYGATDTAEAVLQNVVRHITKLTEQLPQFNTAITVLEQRARESQLSPDEEHALTILQDIQQEMETGEGYELALILQRLGDTPEHGWQLIASLYSKQRLKIKIALAAYN